MKQIRILFYILLLFSACKYDVLPETEQFTIPAIEDIVMYEVNVPAMSINHDFAGVIARLDSIQALGINTIWLMPTYEIGDLNSFGSPYCIKDYKSVNPDMGTLDDLKLLIAEAHKRDIAVLLDWVANHTSWDNEWINNEGWYTTDASGNIISPAGTTWTDVADLNFSNADMRLAMIDAMKYWVEEAGIDGYRCDAADFVPFDFWKQAIDSLNAIEGKNLILLAEGARIDHFTAGFQLNFSWNFLSSLKNVYTASSFVSVLYTTNTAEYASVPAGSRRLRFTTNHDETNIAPPATVYGSQEAALGATVIACYLQGVPLIYCGQEVGVSSSSPYNGFGSINWTVNPELYAQYKQLIHFYANSEAARKGNLQTYTNSNVAIFKKYLNDEEVLVLVNTRSINQNVTLDASLLGEWTNITDNSTLNITAPLAMLPYDYLILKR